MNFHVKAIVPAITTMRHNAFTGLCRHRGRFFLACRSSSDHLAASGDLVVAASDDGRTWRPFARIPGARNVDLRDPKLVSFGGELWLFAARRVDGALRDRESLGYRLDDNGGYEEHVLQGLPERFWLWAVCPSADGRLYGSCYGAQADTAAGGDADHDDTRFECHLAHSDDGVHWKMFRHLPWPCSETFLDSEGDWLYGLGRMDAEPFHPVYFRLSLKDGAMEHRFLPMVLHGPCLKRVPGGSLLIGRHWLEPRFRQEPSVNVWFLADDGRLEPHGVLPSRGDCSYAGVCRMDERTWLISYYSSIQAGVNVCHVFVAHAEIPETTRAPKEMDHAYAMEPLHVG